LAELFRHTDEDGARLDVLSRNDGGLLVSTVRFGERPHLTCGATVDVPAVDGRRLLAALLKHYGSKDSIEEEERRG
jgi:hypothetical protein